MHPDDYPEPIEIPPASLSPDALRGVIEAWVLREGTEYGARDHSLAEKVSAVQAQLECGEAQILFDPHTEHIELVVRQRLARKTARAPD